VNRSLDGIAEQERKATMGRAFRMLGERPARRLGFGAMRLTGPGIWDPPNDVSAAKAKEANVAVTGA
jgi:hypothetical protein